jgi:hypothetical protein
MHTSTGVGQPASPIGAPPAAPAGVEAEWGLRVRLDDAVARRSDAHRLVLSTLGQAPLSSGSFELTVTVDPGRASAGEEALAQAAREAWDGPAEDAVLEQATLLGLPAAAFTFVDGSTQGLHVVAVSGHCVVELVVLRDGPAAALTSAASDLLRRIEAVPSPLSPPRCR